MAELDEPVQDQAGFVYEKAAIVGALRQAAQERMNWVECPLPGVSHKIMLHNLQPANRKRLARLKRARDAHQAEAGRQAGAGRVVLDVE